VSRSAAEWGLLAGWRLVRAMPGGMAGGLFRRGADYAYKKNGRAVRQLARNLRRVTPAMPEDQFVDLVRAGMRSYARYWCEAFRLPSMSPSALATGFGLENAHLLIDAHKAGTGAVVALPHSGNWDAAGAWVVTNGMPLATVAERLKPEGVYEQFLAFRRRLGMEIVPHRGGARPSLDVLADRLRDSAAIVPLVAERDLSTRGVEVSFFGETTKMPPGPAVLALRTGAPLFVCDLWYTPDRPVGRIRGPLPVAPGDSMEERIRGTTQAIADELAKGIAEHPADWHMLQPLWLADLEKRRN
jgi:KDO2-lipid IV(A) lauroyltransferase